MSYESAWSLDFCLSCDNQTSDGAYCSQACRLADLDKAQYTFSDPWHDQVPTHQHTPAPESSNPASSAGFILPPPFDFTLSRKDYRIPSPSLAQEPMRNSPVMPSQRWSFSTTDSVNLPAYYTSLKTTSSRSSMSLDFNNTNSTAQSSPPYTSQLSDDARHQLECYDNSFDTTRHRKHRSFS